MSRLTRVLARTKRRVVRRYHLVCARDDMYSFGLRVPRGLWFCDRCRLVCWEADAFRLHLGTHPA